MQRTWNQTHLHSNHGAHKFMKQTIESLKQAIKLSLQHVTPTGHEADFNINIEGEPWQVYAVYVSHRDVLCLSSNGTATVLVETDGTYKLFDFERD